MLGPTRARRWLVAIVAASAVVASTTQPASAAAAFGPAVRVNLGGSWTCAGGAMVQGSDGVLRGIASCATPTGTSTSIRYLSGRGAAWTSVRVAGVSSTAEVVASTDDGTATYALMLGGSPTHPVASVVTRKRSGAVTATVLGHYFVNRGDIAAAAGRWWAVWTTNDGGCGCSRLFSAKTMGGRVTAHELPFHGDFPALAVRSSVSVAMVFNEGGLQFGDLVVGTGTSAGGFVRTTVAAVRRGGPYYLNPSIAVTGSVVHLAFTDYLKKQIVYADNASGHFVMHRFTTQTRGGAHLAVAGSHVAIAWDAQDSTGRVLSPAVAERVGGTWTERLLPALPHYYGDQVEQVIIASGHVRLYENASPAGGGPDVTVTRVR